MPGRKAILNTALRNTSTVTAAYKTHLQLQPNYLVLINLDSYRYWRARMSNRPPPPGHIHGRNHESYLALSIKTNLNETTKQFGGSFESQRDIVLTFRTESGL